MDTAIFIYEVEPIGLAGALEANGVYFVVCSEACLDALLTSMPPLEEGVSLNVVRGESTGDLLPGHGCERCYLPIVPGEHDEEPAELPRAEVPFRSIADEDATRS